MEKFSLKVEKFSLSLLKFAEKLFIVLNKQELLLIKEVFMKYVWILCFLLCQSAWSATQEELDNQLFDLLITGGTVQEIQDVIARGANPDAKFGEFKLAPLHFAIEYKRPTLVLALLDANADPEIRDAFGFTPLHYAVQKRDRVNVLALLEANVEVDARNDKGNTASHYANGHLVIMADLLNAEADINTQNNAGKTPADNLAQCISPDPFVITAFMALGAEFDDAMQIRINQARERQIAFIHKSVNFFESMNAITKDYQENIKTAVKDISIELPVVKIGWFGWTVAELGGGEMDIELEVDEMPAFKDMESGIKDRKDKMGEKKDLEKAIQKARDIEREMQEAEKEGESKLLVYETMLGESPMETLYAADEYFCKKYKFLIKHQLVKKYTIYIKL